MRALLDPVSFLVVSLAGWMNQHQQHVIHYLIEENRVLREQIGDRRMRFTDDQRRRLAARAKKIGRKLPRRRAGNCALYGFRRSSGGRPEEASRLRILQ